MRARWRVVALVLLLSLLAACGAPAPWRQESYVFGTRVELLIAGAPHAEAQAAGVLVLREFDRLHHTYHAWRASELTALNEALAAGRSAEVSEELAGWLREAQALSRLRHPTIRRKLRDYLGE